MVRKKSDIWVGPPRTEGCFVQARSTRTYSEIKLTTQVFRGYQLKSIHGSCALNSRDRKIGSNAQYILGLPITQFERERVIFSYRQVSEAVTFISQKPT